MLGEKVAHVNVSPNLCIPGSSAKSKTPSSVYLMLGEKVAPVNVTPHPVHTLLHTCSVTCHQTPSTGLRHPSFNHCRI